MYLFLTIYHKFKKSHKKSIPTTRNFVVALMASIFSLFADAAVANDSFAEEFIVKDIKTEGLRRVSSGTLFNSLNIKLNDKINEQKINEEAKKLYALGFFNDIRFYKQDNILIIKVDERPLINSVTIKQNRFISTESMLETLKTVGLSEGDIFQRFALDTIKFSLEHMYMEQGRYGTRIVVETKELPGNQINISITTKEGDIAKVENVNLIGNKKVVTKELLTNLEIGKRPWYMFFSKKGLYWRERLAGDLSRLRSYYLDRGYFNIDINYVNVRFTPDKKSVFVSIGLNEGKPYTIDNIKLAGDLIITENEALSLVKVKSKQLYSQKDVTETESAIKKRLGELGYYFVSVESVPKIDAENNKIDLTFYVSPGSKVYVRRINFSGNIVTEEQVLRREMRQLESAVTDTSKIERSKQRLQLLDLFSDVKETIVKVPGTENQIDINYAVKEKSTGEISFSIAYAQPDGMTLGAMIGDSNFLGTGKSISASANKNDSTKSFNINYSNPYFTDSGISQSWDLHYRKHSFSKSEVSSYTTNSKGIGTNWSYPISEKQRVYLGVSYTEMEVFHEKSVSKLIKNYIKDHTGNRAIFHLPKFNLKWVRSTVDSNILPTKGNKQEFSFVSTLFDSTAKFYKVGFNTDIYIPIYEDFIFRTAFNCGYMGSYKGDKPPFFEHYYVGGLGSVRGFKPSSIGPDIWVDQLSTSDQTNILNKYKNNDLKAEDVTDKVKNFGGNVFAYGSFEILLPIPFASQKKSMRCSLFLDYGINSNTFYKENEMAHSINWSLNELKYSAGISLFWLTPIGAITMSLAQPFNVGPFDSKNKFQITLGEKFF